MFFTIKFGGETVGTGERIRNMAQFLKNRRNKSDDFVVVTSAMAGDTDELVSVAREVICKDSHSQISEMVKNISEKHISACREAINDQEILSETIAIVEEEIRELEKVLEEIEDREEFSPSLQDLIMSFGERLTAPILSGAIRDLGLSSESLTGFEAGIVTDDNHLDADPLIEKSSRQIRERLGKKLDEDVIPVVTGFIASTEKGEITTMGRGSSDYSASLIGSVLGADEIWIMSDVDGIMTADPEIESEARVIDRLSYLEATEMSHFGAEVLNPKTIEPAMNEDIPVRVKNAFEPEKEGTLIVHKSEKVGKIVKAVTATRKVSVVTVGGPSMIGTSGVAAEVLETLEEAGIKVLMISQSSSQTNISFAINRDDLKETLTVLRREFESRHVDWRIDFDEKASIVSTVGAGMKGTPGVAGRVFSTMGKNNVNILMIAQGSSELNISFAIEEKDAEKAVRVLHKEFNLSS